MHVTIAGWFGSGNIGDESIQLALVESLAATFDQVTFDLLSFDLESSRRLYRDDPRIHRLLRVGSRATFHRTDFSGLLRALRKADLVLIGGGGLFQDLYNWYFPPFFATLAATAKMLRKPLGLLGVGIGPLRGPLGRNATRLAAHLADLIVVRDEPSARELAQLGLRKEIHVTADLGLLLPPAAPRRGRALLDAAGTPESRRPRIAVVVQKLLPWNGQQGRALAAALDQIIDAWGAQIVFIPFGQYPAAGKCGDGQGIDAIAALDIHKLMKRQAHTTLLLDKYPPGDLLAAIGECDLVLSMRYHGLVMAAAAGRPCLALTYRAETKLRNFMAQLGSPDDVLDVETFTQAALASHLAAAFGELDQRQRTARRQAVRLTALGQKSMHILGNFVQEFKPAITTARPQEQRPAGE